MDQAPEKRKKCIDCLLRCSCNQWRN